MVSIVSSHWLQCTKTHDMVFVHDNKISLDNIEGAKCVWCCQGDARSRSFRALHEELASQVQLYRQAMARATLTSRASSMCTRLIDERMGQLQRAAATSKGVQRLVAIAQSEQ